MIKRIFVGANLHVRQATLILQGPFQQLQQVIRIQRLEFENLRAGDQGGIDEEKRIVSRGSDQANHATLNIRQQHILL